MVNDKRILVHKGALGDFLVLWPCLYALSRGDGEVFWYGREGYRPWVTPLGLRPCDRSMLRDLDRLYSEEEVPESLRDFEIVWFGLDRDPLAARGDNLRFVHGVEPGLTPGAQPESPRLRYARALGLPEDLAVPGGPDWRAAFRNWFGGRVDPASRRILIFAGAGHPAKAWSLVQYFELARWLTGIGLEPTFVLGPAELDRGLEIPGEFSAALPEDLGELSTLINDSRGAIGNDCGPMHLVGMLGRPGVVLFGPTSPRQWGPPGLLSLCADPDCGPCSFTGRVDCLDVRCLRDLGQDRVRTAMREVLGL